MRMVQNTPNQVLEDLWLALGCDLKTLTYHLRNQGMDHPYASAEASGFHAYHPGGVERTMGLVVIASLEGWPDTL